MENGLAEQANLMADLEAALASIEPTDDDLIPLGPHPGLRL